MSTFNDILKSAIKNVQPKEFDKEEWAREKKEQREWAYRTQDEMAEKIVVDSEILKQYLNIQSRFENYSVGNDLLVTAQNPKATQLRDVDGWKRDKIYLKRNPNKVTILEPSEYTREDGTDVVSYNPKVLYDISETQVKGKINTIPYTHESILKGILSIAPVEIEPVAHELSNGKGVSFNISKRKIEVNQEIDTKDIIIGLIKEISSIHMGTIENTELNEFKNNCATYLTCVKYGIPTQNIDLLKIPEELKQMTPQDIKAEIAEPVECFQVIADGIDRTMDIQPRTRNNREYER